ncbi:MAG TPA: DNA polymerase III subunit beta [Saprospiraceae bacterium]|nr:DNA polymerase III subunit beta [Saprospiraceae bacterium]
MKFEVSSSQLLDTLQLASGAVSPNPVLPVLNDFLFELRGEDLTITGTNLETTIVCQLKVLMGEEGTIAVPAKIILETLRALPDQPVSFFVDQDTHGILLRSSYGEYKLAGDNPEDFPTVPEPIEAKSFIVPSTILTKGINNTVFAAGNDELRLAMTGILCKIDEGKIVFVATDAHKLVKYTYAKVNTEFSDAFIMPKKGFNLLKNALQPNVDVEVVFDKKNAFFTFNDTMVICRLLDAKYPDYNSVIPVENPYLLTIGRRDFQNSLRRISIYSNKSSNQVILNLSENSLTISAQDIDFSNEATEQLACSYLGEPMTIGFNAKFMVEMLGVIDSDEIMLELSKPSRAGILLPAEQAEDQHLLMLAMPVMMSN